jgi:hypothetical protein
MKRWLVRSPLKLRRFRRIALTERVPDESTIRRLVRSLGAEEICRAVIAETTNGERRFAARARGSTPP